MYSQGVVAGCCSSCWIKSVCGAYVGLALDVSHLRLASHLPPISLLPLAHPPQGVTSCLPQLKICRCISWEFFLHGNFLAFFGAINKHSRSFKKQTKTKPPSYQAKFISAHLILFKPISAQHAICQCTKNQDDAFCVPAFYRCKIRN